LKEKDSVLIFEVIYSQAYATASNGALGRYIFFYFDLMIFMEKEQMYVAYTVNICNIGYNFYCYQRNIK